MAKRIVSIRKFATCFMKFLVFELKHLPYVGTVKKLPVKSYYKHRGFQRFVDSNFRPRINMNVVTLAGMRRTPLLRRKYSCY